ncbi:MAG: glycosyltransferase, partial [Rhizomicrobium sp.]
QFDHALSTRFCHRLTVAAVSQLAQRNAGLSAQVTMTRGQSLIAGVLFLLLMMGVVWWPQILLRGLVLTAATGFSIGICLRLMLALRGTVRDTALKCPRIRDADLPVYTVLIPLFGEAAVVPSLTQSLSALDYPRDKLDIKFVVEADDWPTRLAAGRAAQQGPFETVLVPYSLPRTKPKACNYALHFARGDFLVIFDAEDRPCTDQLRKAVAAFGALPAQIACLQARLIIDNARDGLLPTLFAIDYDIWFSVLLPGLARLRVPIPLGGTSNHFRIGALRQVYGWDPFNVTEDADLGVRLAQFGYGVAMLDSYTAEEAPLHVATWMRQRTRWLKGYMQTLLVHLRAPVALARHTGIGGMAMVLTLLGGTVCSALLNPILWLVFVLVHLHLLPQGASDPAKLLAIWSGSGLLITNGFLIGSVFMSERWQARPWRVFYGFGMLLYWLLISVAAWRALWQLLVCPHRWEKTPHGAARCRAGI